MKPLPPLSSSARHGGNGYRGPGAWKRHKKKHFAVSEGPLDLGRILGNLEIHEQQRSQQQQFEANSRFKQGKALALRARLDSLSPLLAPSHGVCCSSPSPAATSSECPDRGQTDQSQRPPNGDGDRDPSEMLLQHHPQRKPASGVPNVREDKPTFETCSGQQTPSAIVTPSAAGCALEHDYTPQQIEGKITDTEQRATNALPSNVSNGDAVVPRGRHTPGVDALRVPNGPTKMSVDDRCTSDILGARATLRALHNENKKIGGAMRRRRMESCLGDVGSRVGGSVSKGRDKPIGYTTRRKRSRHDGRMRRTPKNVVGGTEEKGVRGAAAKHRFHPHAHPLLVMAEADLQKIEQDQMQLEDTGGSHLLKLEEARRRKQDYATYYRLAISYGPLTVDQFEQCTYPGSYYQNTILDATRVLQNWWWSVWPTLLRRRKAAALAIQSVFRGFRQRRKWHAIIRLRTLWGNTRIVAHSFTVWRSTVESFQRVKVFAERCKTRTKAKCLGALRCNAIARRTSREKLLRERLRRVSDGLRLRVFEGWVRYAETSLAITRLGYRSSARPAFLGWRAIASADRIRCRLRWACATLASRLLRWRQRSSYTRLRASCVKIQVVARVKIASTRLRRDIAESRTRRAEEIVQAREDVRVRRLIDLEQERLDRLHAANEQGMPSAQKKALAFLGTAAGKTMVASRLAVAPSSPESEAEAKRETARRFVWREQALSRHDFNAISPPPPLRCPRSDCCSATFVDRDHCLRHAADVHPEDAREVAELSAVMRDPNGLAALERFIKGATFDDSGGGAADGGVDRQARSNIQEAAEQPLPGDDAGGAADDEILAARDTLNLWKEIEEWRKVPSSSPDEGRYKKLAASIVSSSKRGRLPDYIRAVLGGGQSLHLFGKVGTTHKTSTKILAGASHRTPKAQPPSSTSSGNLALVDDVHPFTLEEASSRAVVFLSESEVGRAFLGSDVYSRYLEEVHKPRRDAVEAEAATIAAAEVAEWAAEARRLRKEALDRQQGEQTNALAGHASDLILQGAGGDTFLEGLVDDQASILAAMIIAERSTFAKVISAVWNETVDEAARLTALELRGIDPRVAAALSEAACSSARSRIMDELIDQCTVDLTGPEGELWPDARAMTAVADGLGYQVRSEIMSELIDAAVLELSASGEAETLMSEADAARRRRQESGLGEGREDLGEEEARAEVHGDRSAGGGVIVPGYDGCSSEPGREAMPDCETPSETAMVAAGGTASSSVLTLKGAAHEVHKRKLSVDERVHGSTGEGDDGGGQREEKGRQFSDSGSGAVSNDGMTEVDPVILVQSALRRKNVYRKMKTKVARNFIRMYDPGERAFYWYNNTTMESSWDKPAIIDLFFKKPAVAKSVLCLGQKSSTRPSIVSGFESST